MIDRRLISLFVSSFVLVAPSCAEDIYHNPSSAEGAWPFTLEMPICDDFYVLRKIMHDFQTREREFWSSDLAIVQFDNINETEIKDRDTSYTPRRYCKSTAYFSDGIRRDVVYNISPDQSVILNGPVIDWCVVGLDRAHVDGVNCKRVAMR